MLAKEKCSIEKVSNSVGYPVISTFMRNFKKITGNFTKCMAEKSVGESGKCGSLPSISV